MIRSFSDEAARAGLPFELADSVTSDTGGDPVEAPRRASPRLTAGRPAPRLDHRRHGRHPAAERSIACWPRLRRGREEAVPMLTASGRMS
jgi:hypothetical protein